MKKSTLFLLTVFAMALAGCGQQVPGLNQNTNQPTANLNENTNAPSPQKLIYLVSTEDSLKYCNGAEMDSEGFKKTITKEVTTDISVEGKTTLEIAKMIIANATTGQCKNALEKNDLRIEGNTAYFAPIDGWAGVSIAMCSCIPQIEVNFMYLLGIEKVVFESSIQAEAADSLTAEQKRAFEKCKTLSGEARLELSALYGEKQIFCAFAGTSGECTQGELNSGACFKEKK